MSEANIAEYDEDLGQWVGETMDGGEVYGTTRADCEMRLQDANRVYLDHCRHNEPPSQISDSRDSAEMLGV